MNRSAWKVARAARAWVTLLLVVVLGTTGCETGYPSLTCKVWTSASLQGYREPADDPAVRVYRVASGRNWLVTYDEVVENRGSVRRRAFYVEPNRGRLATGRAPRFVSLSRTNGLELVPVVEAGAGAGVIVAGRRCVIGMDGGDRLEFELPTYAWRGATAVRVVLTPLAVVGDTAAFAAVVALAAAVTLAGSGFTYSP